MCSDRSPPATEAVAFRPALKPYDGLERQAQRASDLLRGLANRERLTLLCSMLGREMCVGELHAATGIAQPTLSQQLAVLRRQRLVTTRRDGKRIFYSIGDPAAVRVLEALHAIYCAPDAAVAATTTAACTTREPPESAPTARAHSSTRRAAT